METIEKISLMKEERYRQAILATYLLSESQRRLEADLERDGDLEALK
ncbi:MAG: hypothetical protein H7Y12_00745 [Sphingobacteriaceae bacterium]|nr:hypothetical protein [Cytophagaceae bacterium]